MIDADRDDPSVHDVAPASRPLRVAIQQPSLAKYRVPVYRELASRPNIDLTLFYSTEAGIPNVEPVGFKAEHVDQHRLPLGFRWSRAHARVADPTRFDVAVVSWAPRALSLLPALAAAKRRRVGVVAWGHGYSKRERGWRKAVRTRIGAAADALLFYNHTARNRHLQESRDDPGRCFVALNSLDQGPIREARRATLADPRALEHFQREHGLDPRATLLYVSRLDPNNRVDMLVRAIARLRETRPSLKAVVVGAGDQLDELRALASNLGVAESVLFLGAVYGEASLAPWFCSARAFCYPANVGLSLLHAFGYGLPAVTSDRLEAQNPEIEALRHEENGLLYADGSQEALEAALARLLDDDELHARLVTGAEETVRDRFSLPRMVDGMIEAANYAKEQASARARNASG